MTDLHTHILPGMDDGSRDVQESLRLVAMEREQGVTQIVLTPHYYRWREEPESFLTRRSAAMDRLQRAVGEDAPAFRLGAEVAWFPTIVEFKDLDKLCIGDSGQFLLELPYEPWNTKLIDRLYSLTCSTGLLPILAHVERYIAIEPRQLMDELIDLGLPMQMNADSLLRVTRRRKCLKLLRRGRWYLASDCHSLDSRPPKLVNALKILENKTENLEYLTNWNDASSVV